jgi:hypothetical protein
MERHDKEFNVIYCYRLEKYLYTFWRRVNHLVVFLQIFLSTMVFSGISGTQWYGAFMAALTIGAFVYRPDAAMAIAKSQLTDYSQFRRHMKEMSDEELDKELDRVKDKDSDPLGFFENPAYNRACVEISQPTYVVKLARYESIIAWMFGDLPPSKKIDDNVHD